MKCFTCDNHTSLFGYCSECRKRCRLCGRGEQVMFFVHDGPVCKRCRQECASRRQAEFARQQAEDPDFPDSYSSLRCPYCGYEPIDPSHEEDTTHYVTCGSCDRRYSYTITIDVSYLVRTE
jgi:hypothetical protein